ncbi:MAG: hypothetical protein R3A45_13405 [Bdellovibrionota bacterium]
MKNMTKNKRVVIAMSGGVDSSVAAYILPKDDMKYWAYPCVCGLMLDTTMVVVRQMTCTMQDGLLTN